MDYEKEIEAARKFIVVGKSYTLNHTLPAYHPNRKKIHVRAIVDDDVVVYRSWSKRKQGWRYSTEILFYYALMMEGKRIKRG
jgi:hypothetical protein